MQLSETVKLYMTKEQKALVVMAMNEYINTVNSLVCVAVNGVSISKYTTADVNAYLPSALTNQCIRDAKSIISKYNKECHKVSVKNKKLTKQKSAGIVKKPKIPVLKRPCCYINNQNFKIKNSTTGTSRKNNHSLHTWSFYRLAQYIEYKAGLEGIKVEYVNPAYTSQTCPVCGHVHHANDRNYTCKCGFHIHRDLLGAMNICNSTEYVGDSNVRHTA